MMLQRQLPFVTCLRRPDARHPLVTVEVARIGLGVDAETVVEAIEDGRLAWAFNIAQDLWSRCRELRIWSPCLGTGPLPCDELEEVVADIIGTSRPTVRGAEVERLLLCSSAHVKALHDGGLLRGEIVGHTRHVTRESLAAFLSARRVL